MSGIPMKYRLNPSLRLTGRLVPNGDCLEWTGSRNEHGYGGLRVDGVLIKTHRYAYELAHGPLPIGLDVLHSCDNPPCCNIEHLRLGDAATNARDMVDRGRHGLWTHPERRARGEANPSARLTESGVAAIRQLIGARSLSSIAREFCVSVPTIARIRDGKTWRTAA